MSKRFIDTDLWSKDWFMELTPAEKLAWVYLTTQCDNVGVWKPNFRLAEFVIGTQLDWEKFAGKTDGNVEILDNGKWWVVDFCIFQHPDLGPDADSESNRNHATKSYARDLKAHGLWGAFKGRLTGVEGASEGPKERKGKGKGKEQEEAESQNRGRTQHPTLTVPIGQTRYDNLCQEWGRGLVDSYIERAVAYAEAHSKPYSDYAAAAWTYMQRDIKDGKLVKRAIAERPKTHKEQAREAFGEEYHGE